MTGQNSFWFANPSTGFYPFEIEQSIRITNNGYLNMSTNGFANAPTLTTKGTVSFWIKLQNNGGRNYIMQNEQAYSNDGLMDIRFGGSASNDGMHIGRLSDTPYTASSTGPRQRDYSNWYHCVVGFDSTSATASDRQIRIYINGTQVTTGSFGAINQNAHFPLTKQGSTYGGLTFGQHPNPSFNYFTDMLLAEINIIDGQRLDSSYFGEFKNGTWIPIEYTGTYGNNGCRFTFASSDFNVSGSSVSDPNGSSVDLFNNGISDASGNGNHLNLNSVSTHDILLDSPTNNFCVINANRESTVYNGSVTLSEGNLQSVDAGTTYSLHWTSTFGMSTGKWYWEVLAHTMGGTKGSIGICNSLHRGGTAGTGVFYGNNGNREAVTYYTPTTTYGDSYTNGDIIGVAFDADNETVTFYKNNSSQGAVGSVLVQSSGPYFAAAGDAQNATTYKFVVNFGQDSSFAGNKTAQGNKDGNGNGDFYYSPPSGYLALCSANLPDTTISPNQAEQATDYFNTVIYTGNGTADRAIDVGFATDFFWVKQRSAGNHHQLTDTSRGVLKGLSTSNTLVENTFDSVRSFTSTGVTVGTSATTNSSSATYVAWNWKANGGTTSSNTDGSITSTVQASTEAGFSIVTYTSNNTAGATVGHGLGKVPSMILTRNREDERNWGVYHHKVASDPETDGLFLNLENSLSDSASYWNDTAPTSTVFSLGSGAGETNFPASDGFVAYCFTEIEGYSKFGTYTGNGSSDGPFAFTGFRPAFVMLKNTSNSSYADWVMFDNKRDPDNTVVEYLSANNSEAEFTGGTSYPFMDFLSNGFKLRLGGTGSQVAYAVNRASGDLYLYMAFAEQPFQFSNAR